MARTFVWAGLGGAVCVSLLGTACSDGAVTRGTFMDPNAGNVAGAANGTAGNMGANTSGSGGANGSTAGSGGQNQAGTTQAQGGVAAIPTGKGVGEACSDDDPCRPGLSCGADATCAPAGETLEGEACVIGAECKDGQCLARACVPAGAGKEGEGCLTDGQCAAGLRCAIVGLGLSCVPEGAADVGADCATSTDCFAGLVCLADKCAPAPATRPGELPVFGQPWAGAECPKPVPTDVKAYFEVPGADGADEADFFRLPFPTDIRRHGDKLDLSGFPTPGAGLLGVDPVQLYVDAIEENDSAWGAYPTVLFRFSGPFESFARDAVQFMDVTDPAKGHGVGWQRFYTSGRSAYICDNFVGVQPPLGSPLEPGHTYAVFILGQAQDLTLSGAMDHKPVTRSANMTAVLADEVPTDAKLKAAHTAFAPLREFLATYKDKLGEQAFPPDNVLTASVFTVGDVRGPMTKVAEAVAAADAPTASKWVKCGGAEPSPCAQADGSRACGDDVDGYDEYHALLSIPVFQQGTAPYLTPADGGDVDPAQSRAEEVCLSITVPETAPPAAGWPAVVFAHGTGGNFRNHVRPEVAGVLAAATPKFAVIGIDQVEHGPRRGASMQSPDNLFFNFLNPAAARGNPLQGAADQLSVARFAKALDVDAATTTGAAIKIDGSKLLFFGHSQGSTEGSLMLPFGDDYKAALLSGNGGSLRDALRTKTEPVNIAGALPIVLQDPYLNDPGIGSGLTAFHPVLSLLQQWIDPADPINFAYAAGHPLTGHQAKHVFQTFGLDDSYSPPLTLMTYALAAGVTQVTADASAKVPYRLGTDASPHPFDTTVDAPFKAANTGVTLGMRQYGAPKGSDGHFVVFDTQAANDDMVQFLTGAAGATPPAIGH